VYSLDEPCGFDRPVQMMFLPISEERYDTHSATTVRFELKLPTIPIFAIKNGLV